MPVVTYWILGLFGLSIALSIGLAIRGISLWSRGLPARLFTAVTISQFIWCLFAALELIFVNPEVKVILLCLMYLGTLTTPVGILSFALAYTGRGSWITGRRTLALAIVPILTFGIVCTNGYHQAYWTDFSTTKKYGLHIADVERGPLYWPNLFYSYFLVGIALAILIRYAMGSAGAYRRQTLIVIGGLLLPLSGNVLDRLNINPVDPIDVPPILFGFSGIALSVGIGRYRLLDVIPVAHAAVIRDLGDPVLVFDTNRRIVEINPVAAEVFGLERDVVIGQQVQVVLERFPEISEHLQDLGEVQFDSGHQNSGRSWEWKLGPLLENRQEIGWILLGRDITQRQQAAEAERLARRAAEAASQAKSQFLATITHEIRTPLHVVSGMAQLLGQSSLTNPQQDHLEQIKQANEHLLALIDNILEYSRIEAQSFALLDHPYQPRETLQRAISVIEPLAQRKGLEVQLELPIDSSIWLRGDSSRIGLITLNLLANAVKFTHTGFIRLEGSIESHAATGCDPETRLIISVADSGIGIAAQDFSRIFERFTQLDGGLTRRESGIGLGLALTQKIVEAMGGAIDLTSQLGRGTRFEIRLPVVLIEPQEIDPDCHSNLEDRTTIADFPSLADRHPMRILVAEDDPMSRKMIGVMLGKLGYHPTIVCDGRQLVQCALAERFDLILTDIQMPELDGIQAIRELRQQVLADQVPHVVLITANLMDVHLDSSISEWLGKPFRISELARVLIQCASSSRASLSLPTAEFDLSQPWDRSSSVANGSSR